jgi:hypothetical protein
VNGNRTVPSYTLITFSENWNLRLTPRGKVGPLTLMPDPLRRTVVGIAYSLAGRLEFTCSPPGMLSTTDPRAEEPRATLPFPIDPLTVCADAIAAPTVKIVNTIPNILVLISYFG